MKHLVLILVALSTACGGAEFSPSDSIGAGGDDSVAAAGSVTVTAGRDAGGTAAVGGSSASGMAGSAPAPTACELDPAKLAAALPTTLTWSGFVYAGGETCVKCRHEQCTPMNVISWGTPQEYEGDWIFLPNTDKPMVGISIGANDGVCAPVKECGAKLSSPSLRVSVSRTDTGWIVESAKADTQVTVNACTAAAGADPGLLPMAQYFSRALEDQAIGLEIPCK